MAAYVLAQLAVASPKSVLHLIDQIEQELDFCEAEQLEWEVVMDRLDRLASNNPD